MIAAGSRPFVRPPDMGPRDEYFTREMVLQRLRSGIVDHDIACRLHPAQDKEDAINSLANEIMNTLGIGHGDPGAVLHVDASVDAEVVLAQHMAWEFPVTDLEIMLLYIRTQLIFREPGKDHKMEEEDHLFCRYVGGTEAETRAQHVVPELFRYKIPRADVTVGYKAAQAWSEVVRERFYSTCPRGHTNEHLMRMCTMSHDEMKAYVLANNPKFTKKPMERKRIQETKDPKKLEPPDSVGAGAWPASVGAGKHGTAKVKITRDTNCNDEYEDEAMSYGMRCAGPWSRVPRNLTPVGRLRAESSGADATHHTPPNPY